MKTSVFLSVAALLSLAGYIRAQGDSDPPSQCQQDEAADRKACFDGLDLAAMPQNLDVLHPLYVMLESTFTMMDPQVHCSNPVAYRQAARCAVNVSKSCYDPGDTLKVIMDPDDVIAGMQVLCDKRQQVDMECYKNFYVMVDECRQYHRRARASLASLNTQSIVCALEDLMYDCMEVIMTPMCGDNTTQVFLEQMDKYTVKPGCVNGTEPSRPRTRYFPSLQPPASHMGSGAPLVHTDLLFATLFLLASVHLMHWV